MIRGRLYRQALAIGACLALAACAGAQVRHGGGQGRPGPGGAADPPVYAADGRSVTITLKDLTWSGGVPVTSRDVESGSTWYGPTST
ncbi:MAG TPA: hypothetical protein VGH72_27800, partial [Pseudonocardia sp.]